MESYIVRIYRRDKGNLLGMVEEPGKKEKAAFTDYDGLWDILNPRGDEDRLTDHGGAENEQRRET